MIDMGSEASRNTIRLGIIAGAGQFPAMVALGAKRAGCHVTMIGLKGLAEATLAQQVDDFRWAGVAKLGQWIRIFRRQHVSQVILAGAVRKDCMYGRFRLLKLLPDLTSIRLWFFQIPDKRNDTVLTAIADEFAKHEMVMNDCIAYSQNDMAPAGVLTKAEPSEAQLKDIAFGWDIAKQMGRLDIGQAIAVKETEVIAVEAIEGTDRLIERAGLLCKHGGWTLIKVAKPNQDMRFDVPTVGPNTIASLQVSGAKMLVIEAKKTLIVDREAMLSAATRAGIVVVSQDDTHSDSIT